MKTLLNVIAYLWNILLLSKIIMFFYGVHMFTARREFSDLERDLAEFFIVFWMPTLFGGLIMVTIGFTIQAIKRANIHI